ncbi:MAG: hypothetical protein JW807_00290 [Spirochaetes bacterium]|nr:hypothetical protein [Spirochaetota bacterium]
MKKAFMVILCVALTAVISTAQEKKSDKQYKLESEQLDRVGKSLDAQILAYGKRMAEIIHKYELLKASDLRIIPYQTTYVMGSDYIEMEKHHFIRDDALGKEITGLQTKRIKIYTNGQSISKIESEIYDRMYWAGTSVVVRMTDPSPLSEGTDDIVFTHIANGKVLLENKKLGDIKNTTAFPIRNELKRDFVVPHMSYFMNSLLFIAESYNKGLKDAESVMSNFLKKSQK